MQSTDVKILWGVNFVVLLLVLMAGSCSFLKHHPEYLSAHKDATVLAVKPMQRDRFERMIARAKSKYDEADAADRADAPEEMLAKSNAKYDVLAGPAKSSSARAALGDGSVLSATERHDILPKLPIDHLPYVIFGLVLALPILTISVFKGCRIFVGQFSPIEGALQPADCVGVPRASEGTGTEQNKVICGVRKDAAPMASIAAQGSLPADFWSRHAKSGTTLSRHDVEAGGLPRADGNAAMSERKTSADHAGLGVPV